jgi:hypothetical protein
MSDRHFIGDEIAAAREHKFIAYKTHVLRTLASLDVSEALLKLIELLEVNYPYGDQVLPAERYQADIRFKATFSVLKSVVIDSNAPGPQQHTKIPEINDNESETFDPVAMQRRQIVEQLRLQEIASRKA